MPMSIADLRPAAVADALKFPRVREVNGKPILWGQDFTGKVHQCEGARVTPDHFMVWTLCEIDVPPGKAWEGEEGDTVTCPACLAAMANPDR